MKKNSLRFYVTAHGHVEISQPRFSSLMLTPTIFSLQDTSFQIFITCFLWDWLCNISYRVPAPYGNFQ